MQKLIGRSKKTKTTKVGSDGMKLYIDGVLADSDPYTGGLGTTSGGTGNYEPIAIGANTWASGDLVLTPLSGFFDGLIDEVAILDQSLSAQTIQDLYSSVATPEYVVAEEATLNVSVAEGVLANAFNVSKASIGNAASNAPSKIARTAVTARLDFRIFLSVTPPHGCSK